MQPKLHINNMQKKLNCRLYITIVMKKYEIEIDAMYLKSAETEQKYSLFDCIAMFLKKTPSPDISRGTREGLRKANKRTTTLCLRCIDGQWTCNNIETINYQAMPIAMYTILHAPTIWLS